MVARTRSGAFPLGRAHPLAVLLIYLSLAALLGGGSRADIESLVLLRPLAVLFTGYALITIEWAKLRTVAFPLGMVLAFMALHLLQLIPLPPQLWTALPRRALIESISASVGTANGWRPLSLSPAGTWNSFFALFVPLGAIALFAGVEAPDRRKIFYWLVAFALASSVFGVLQELGGAHSPFYLYSVTNEGLPVGLFANRNHQSVLLACAIFTCFWFIGLADRRRPGSLGLAIVAAALALFLLPLIFVTGSRAGLGLSAVALVIGVALVARAQWLGERIAIGGRQLSGRWLASILFVLLAALAVAVIYTARDVAFSRFLEQDQIEDMRFAILPVLKSMLADFSGWGSGFGSFESVYRLYEPFSLLGPRYLNEAHDDWIQLAIEGGLPALLLLLAALVWLVRAIFLQRGELTRRNSTIIPATWVILALGTASLFDYPLRVPSLSALFAVMICVIATGSDRRDSSPASELAT